MRRYFYLSILAALCLSVAGPASLQAHSKSTLRDDMRVLWIDHAAWTRMYIISAAAGLPDTDFTAQRLLRNQDQIGNAFADFYGREVASQLTALLKDHILIAAELVGAAKAGDTAKVNDARERWYQNADDISMFLHQANPKNWPASVLKSAMRTHLDQTLAEATHRLQGSYQADILDYDEIVDHMLMMADTLSDGIIAQFPRKFSRGRS